jgi:serine/threonine protein kinase/Tfp pilus assembly protein PilF
MNMSIKCPECQHENPEDVVNCENCSTSLKPEEGFSPTKTLETPAQGLTSGTTFATRYEVIEELGKGGMGRVYKALDKEINEEVAIKLLKPEIASDESTVDRFRNELKFARKIAHKNICKMYHIEKEGETPFITMEYVPGEDLKSLIKKKGRLSDDEALSIAKQVCEGLMEAHKLGVVHRDLKPQNIMTDEQGKAKIMDFGIARSIDAPGITQTGMMIGTPDYLSPEQAEGDEADQRADIYSLGIILYEMVTGRVPFKGDTALEVALKHKSKLPSEPKELNPEISKDLNTLIMICMQKDRQARYQNAGELLGDIKNIKEGIPLGERILPKKKREINWKRVLQYGGIPLLLVLIILAGAFLLFMGRGPAIDSIAVLPFKNLTGDPVQEYFADGITDELRTRLGKIGAFRRVISHWSVMQYKGTEKPLQEIAQELNVDAVVVGSVRQADDKVSIQFRLVDVFPKEQDLLEETIDRAMIDVLVMNSEIAQAVVRKIRIKLTQQEEAQFANTRQVNPKTYGAYLKGMSHLNKQEIEQALTCFNQAVEEDPKDPLAYTGLAFGYITIGHGLAPTEDVWAQARTAAIRALRLDETLAEGYAALAIVKTYFEWDWEGAEQAYKRAIELNPSLAMTHYHYAWYLALFGRMDEAIAEHELAQELDPLEPLYAVMLGSMYGLGGNIEAAETEIQKALEQNPNNLQGWFNLGDLYAAEGKYEEAIAAHKKLLPIGVPMKWPLGFDYARSGQKEEAWKIVAELETAEVIPWTALGLAVLYSALGEKDKAFQWLDFRPPHSYLPWIRVIDWVDPLRDDPRFHELLHRMNLPPVE